MVDLFILKIFYMAVDRETNQGNPNLHLFSVQSGEIIKSLIQKKQSNWYALTSLCTESWKIKVITTVSFNKSK